MMERTSSARTRAFGSGRLLMWAGLVIFAAVAGMMVAVRPELAWLALGTAAGLVLVNQPAYFWAGGALAAVVLSRVLVSWGVAPSAVNFAHFPLAVAAAVVATLETSEASPLARRMGAGILGLLGVAFASWAWNGGEFLRPVLTWLVFTEPFLLFYALVRSPMGEKQVRAFFVGLLALAALQLPFGLWQAATIGWGDPVAGTFAGLAAGAHVAGAMACLGLLIVLGRSVEPGVLHRGRWVLATLALFVLPVIADAKQVIVAFLPPFALVVARASGRRIGPAVAATGLIAALVVSAAYVYTPLQSLLNLRLFQGGIESKVTSAQVVFQKMEPPVEVLLGLGPGNSMSRVSLLTAGGMVKRSSPVAALGLRTAPTTRELLDSFRSNFMWSSSAWTGISSWLGIFGDFGLLGLLIYSWLGFQIWSASSGLPGYYRGIVSGALLSGLVLGVVYSWLEEPGYTLPLAALCAVACVAGELELRRQPSEPAAAEVWEPLPSGERAPGARAWNGF